MIHRGLLRAILLIQVVGTWHFCAATQLPAETVDQQLVVVAERAERWQEGPAQVWSLSGKCLVQQGDVQARGERILIWYTPALPGTSTHRMAVYLEDGTVVTEPRPADGGQSGSSDDHGFRTLEPQQYELFTSHRTPDFQIRSVSSDPIAKPGIWQRARLFRDEQRSAVQPVQFTQPVPQVQTFPTPGVAAPAGGLGPRVVIENRGTSSARVLSFPSSDGTETVWVLDGGVRARIVDDQTGEVVQISADRIVGWGPANPQNGTGGRPTPAEIYLEGNIDYRQGDRVIQAKRMYYNISQKNGVILDAEVLAPIAEFGPVQDFQGFARLKAKVLRQVDQGRFFAHDAAFTTSRLGVPQYWLQAGQIQITRVPKENEQPSDTFPADPFAVATPENIGSGVIVNSRSNYLYLNGTPLMYWPSFTTDIGRPTFYLESIEFNSDSVFGFQLLTTWDLYQVFGVDRPPERTDWNLSVDYLSDRGVGLGTDFSYEDRRTWLFPGTASGIWDVWGIQDSGLDNLGEDRREVPPEKDLRGRLFARHRHTFSPGLMLNGEVGLISDRNFLEQYFESEWDELKDQNTGAELRRLKEESSWSLRANARVNDFFTQTEWLPRFDHFTIGRSFFKDHLTWYEHSHVGNARLKIADPPTNSVDLEKWDLLAWETPSNGLRAATRQEVDLPLQLGVVKIVPYALGEVAHYTQDVNGEDDTRAYGQLGLRTSLPMYRIDRNVQSTLFNLNGLAHKVDFRSDAYWSDANRNFDQFPLYDQLDDDAVEFARRRYLFDTYGLTFGDDAPPKFDERYYALRNGMQSWVTAESTEIVDDLSVLRMGVGQRWQTKRGRPGEERVIDWITLDIEGALFPKPDRDNFGENFGLVNYDFRWHVGDRVTIVSDGYMDFFEDGLRMITIGGFLTRPGHSQLYGGFRNIEGPFTSHLLTGSTQYRLSKKWIINYSSSIDFGEAGNIGQSAFITRVGESFLATLGFSVDSSRDNVGIRFSIEPRILSPTSQFGRVAGVPIPAVGMAGLE